MLLSKNGMIFLMKIAAAEQVPIYGEKANESHKISTTLYRNLP
jgi:hypothetical protein